MRCFNQECSRNGSLIRNDDCSLSCPECGWLYLACPHAGCETINRAWARYCRNCGKPVYYAQKFDEWFGELQRKLTITARERDSVSLQARRISSILDAQGYVLVIGENGFALINPWTPSSSTILPWQNPFPSAKIIGGCALDPAGLSYLFTTETSLYQVNLAPELRSNVFTATAAGVDFHTPATVTGDYWFARAKQHQTPILCYGQIQEPGMGAFDLGQFGSEVQVWSLPPQKVLLLSSNQVSIFDLQTSATSACPCDFAPSVRAQPAYDQQQQALYLADQQGQIWRLALGHGTAIKIGTKPFNFLQLRFHRSSDRIKRLLVAHVSGISYLDPLTGSELWNTNVLNLAPQNCCLQPPMILQDTALISSRNDQGISGAIMLTMEAAPRLNSLFSGSTQPGQTIVHPPIFTLGGLLVPLQSQTDITLKVWQLIP